MRKAKYSVLIGIIFFQFVFLAILNKLGVQFQSWIANAVGALAFVAPIVLLLFRVGNDIEYSSRVRAISKLVGWFLILCIIGGGLATLLLE